MRSEIFRHKTLWPHQEVTSVGTSFPTKHDVISRQQRALKCILEQLRGCCGERQILYGYGADFYFCYCQESPTTDTFNRVVQTCSVVQIVIETIESCLGFAHSTLRPFIKIYRKQLSSDCSKQLEGEKTFSPHNDKRLSILLRNRSFSHLLSPIHTAW